VTSGPCVMMKEVHVSPHGGATCHMDLDELYRDPRGKRVPCVEQYGHHMSCHLSHHMSYHMAVGDLLMSHM
jgi:hypothetical protein